MNVSTTLEAIATILDAASEMHVLNDEQIAEIEKLAYSLGEFTGDLAEAMTQFRRALAHHRLRNVGADTDSIWLAFAHVHESWESVAPALREFAGAVEVA